MTKKRQKKGFFSKLVLRFLYFLRLRNPLKEKKKGHVLEVGKTKTRLEEEKFFETFSTIQINAVLFFILAATFLTTGIAKYAEIVGDVSLVTRWLTLIIFSILAMIVSIYGISMGGTIHPLKWKRFANMLSFVSFLFGASIFFMSLVILLLMLFA